MGERVFTTDVNKSITSFSEWSSFIAGYASPYSQNSTSDVNSDTVLQSARSGRRTKWQPIGIGLRVSWLHILDRVKAVDDVIQMISEHLPKWSRQASDLQSTSKVVGVGRSAWKQFVQ